MKYEAYKVFCYMCSGSTVVVVVVGSSKHELLYIDITYTILILYSIRLDHLEILSATKH